MATVHLPRPHDGRVLQQFREAFWVLALGVLVGFAFFAALGAFSFGESATLTVAIGLLALAVTVRAWLVARREPVRDPRLSHDRERRGF